MVTFDKQLMTDVLRKLLAPVVRLAIRGGVDARAFTELLKHTYVEVVTEDFGRNGRPTNIARTAMLTGLSRAETSRIRKQLHNDTGRAPAVMDHGFSSLLREWHTNSQYIDGAGKPLPLKFDEDEPDFRGLARKFFSDIPATTVLKELQETDAVQVGQDGRLEVTRDYFMPPPSNPKHWMRIGEVIRDFVGTVLHNLTRDDDAASRVEIRTFEEGVSVSHEPAFYKLLDDEAGKLYKRVDRWLRDKRKYETIEGEKTCRMGVGIYQIHRE